MEGERVRREAVEAVVPSSLRVEDVPEGERMGMEVEVKRFEVEVPGKVREVNEVNEEEGGKTRDEYVALG